MTTFLFCFDFDPDLGAVVDESLAGVEADMICDNYRVVDD